MGMRFSLERGTTEDTDTRKFRETFKSPTMLGRLCSPQSSSLQCTPPNTPHPAMTY